jgi:hypothetical protein
VTYFSSEGGARGQNFGNSVDRAFEANDCHAKRRGCGWSCSLFGLVTEASAKMAQKAIEYQDTPKGDQECSNCSLFQEPNSCTLVDGEISPKGWCKFWVKKAGLARSPARTYTKRRGTPVVTASPCPHAPQSRAHLKQLILQRWARHFNEISECRRGRRLQDTLGSVQGDAG